MDTNFKPLSKKKISKIQLLFYLSLFLATPIIAQTEKGNLMIGSQTNLAYSSTHSKLETEFGTNDYGKLRNVQLGLQFGYFVFNNFLAGIEIPFTFSKEITGVQFFNTTTIAFVPFLSCYFGNGKIKPYLMAGAGPGWGKDRYHLSSDTDLKVPNKIFTYELGGGLGIFLNEHFSIDLGLGYLYTHSKWHDDSTNTDNKYITDGLGFNIGIVYCLNKSE